MCHSTGQSRSCFIDQPSLGGPCSICSFSPGGANRGDLCCSFNQYQNQQLTYNCSRCPRMKQCNLFSLFLMGKLLLTYVLQGCSRFSRNIPLAYINQDTRYLFHIWAHFVLPDLNWPALSFFFVLLRVPCAYFSLTTMCYNHHFTPLTVSLLRLESVYRDKLSS